MSPVRRTRSPTEVENKVHFREDPVTGVSSSDESPVGRGSGPARGSWTVSFRRNEGCRRCPECRRGGPEGPLSVSGILPESDQSPDTGVRGSVRSYGSRPDVEPRRPRSMGIPYLDTPGHTRDLFLITAVVCSLFRFNSHTEFLQTFSAS